MGANLTPLLPAAEVLVTALVVLLLDLFTSKDEKGALVWTSLAGLAVAGWMAVRFHGGDAGAFNDTLLLDRFAVFCTLVFAAVAALTILASVDYVRESGIREGEFYVLILLSAAGMIVMAAAKDLILFFLGLETMSIAVYVLTGMWRARAESAEAAMKYFLIGAFATGFLLYGIALIYGATGTTHLGRMADATGAGVSLVFAAGVFLLLVGLAFKVAAVPFHFWVPDVYDGAPTPATAFMAVAVKAAAFAGWARIFLYQWSPLSGDWAPAVKALALLTMTLGNLLAVTQSSVKRMLAYSSIAHAGYFMIALVAGGAAGGQALLFYVLSYAAMTLGAFGVLAALKQEGREADSYGDFAGLGFRRPFLGMAMSLFMLSLAGFPPLAGFTGKFYLFRSAVAAGHTDLAVIGALNSLVSVFYYLRVILMMYMEEGGVEAKSFRRAPYLYAAIAVSALATVYLGILPAAALDASVKAIASLH